MVKVTVVSNSAILSKAIAIKLISRGYYVDHVFASDLINGNSEIQNSHALENPNIIILDYDGVKKTLSPDKPEKVEEIANFLFQISNNLILISSEKDINKIKSWMAKGVKGIVDSSLPLNDLGEKIYEIIFSIPIEDSDRRKHYRVRVPNNSIAKIFVNSQLTLKGHIYDVSAGGVSIIFDSYEEANSLITNKSYQAQLEFEGISINANIFLVRREGTFCGFRFFNLDSHQLNLLSEYIYHRIIEEKYNESLIKKT